jgi:hypothetical protein
MPGPEGEGETDEVVSQVIAPGSDDLQAEGAMEGGSTRPRAPARCITALWMWAFALPAGLDAASVYCPPLSPPPASEVIVTVGPAQAPDLPAITRDALPYTTILLEDGLYPLQGSLRFLSPHVTLRSASGDRDAVVLDGGYRVGTGELVLIDVEHITIADLTLQRAWYHPVHIVGGGHYATLYNLEIRDGREQFVKVNPVGETYADFGVAACSELELTDTGRAFIQDNPTPGFLCYTGGFDLHQTWGWVIRDTAIRNIYCTNGGLAEHAIHFFRSNRDPIVERNLVVDNARGIGFGLGVETFLRQFPDDPFEGTEMEGREDEVMHIGGVIRNNIVYADIGLAYDVGIGLESAWKPEVSNNTVYSEEGSFNSAIDIRFTGSESIVLANNLYHPRITLRNGAPTPEQYANVLSSADMFAALPAADLHLRDTASTAIDQGADRGLVDDFDGNLRDAHPDVGADEYVVANTRPVVTIGSPLDSDAFDTGVIIDFSGTGTDFEDGDLTAALQWGSSLDGALAVGGVFSTTLSPGLHTVSATVTDSGGLKASDSIRVAVTTPGCPADRVVSDDVVSDLQVERAVRTITVGPGLNITAPGELVLEAGVELLFVDGLVVEDGAELTASLTTTPCS